MLNARVNGKIIVLLMVVLNLFLTDTKSVLQVKAIFIKYNKNL